MGPQRLNVPNDVHYHYLTIHTFLPFEEVKLVPNRWGWALHNAIGAST